ncbi:alpha/beta fold hydrolase [Nonomuraea sp. NPDC050783]|uniref:alpha/beta fold hydrolase n=1 Tax=Nonomuraea sp. NPDC050783 TaxID=3154634 RepID=UPI003465B1B0
MTRIVVAPDGRRIAVEDRGKPDGTSVFLLHGTPGSRIGPSPRAQVLYRLGVRLITFDRPGYGLSDRLPGRTVADVAVDVAAIADDLGVSRFAVAGRSGGAPHALACAALLPSRVTRVAALVSLAPHSAEGLDWFAGMTASNVLEHLAARAGAHLSASRLATLAEEIRADPLGKVLSLAEEGGASDTRTISDHGLRWLMVRNLAEALRRSADGWVDDVLAFNSDWGFDPAVISMPTLVWHGENDVFTPVDHSRWLGRRIPHAILRIQHDVAHLDAMNIFPKILPWLMRGLPDRAH